MDNKQLPTLDPKLKEIYERVMGTNVVPSAAPAATVTSPSQPIPPPTSQQPAPTAQTQTTPAVQGVTPIPISTAPVAHTTAPTATHGAKNAGITTFVAKKQSSTAKMLPVLYVVGGIVFLLVYTVFWMRVFSVPVPFFQ